MEKVSTKGPLETSVKHHKPYVPPAPSSPSVSTLTSSLVGFGVGTTLSSTSGQPPCSSHAGATSGSIGDNGSSVILGASVVAISLSGLYKSPYPTSTGLSATFAQICGSGNDLFMITLAHVWHVSKLISLPSSATVATSSLAFSSAGVLLASEIATVDNPPPPPTPPTQTKFSQAATSCRLQGLLQSLRHL